MRADWTRYLAHGSQILALMAMRNRRELMSRSKRYLADGLAALENFCAQHADKFLFSPPAAGPVAYLKIRGDGITATDAHAYSERLVQQTGVMVIASPMFDADGPFLRLGFAKENFGARLQAWAATFEQVGRIAIYACHAPATPSHVQSHLGICDSLHDGT